MALSNAFRRRRAEVQAGYVTRIERLERDVTLLRNQELASYATKIELLEQDVARLRNQVALLSAPPKTSRR